jgi:hypothetical protein
VHGHTEDEEWNFAYILPKEKTQEPTMLVIPSSLQMGWSDSPAFFCGASKMACDVAEELIKEPKGLLPPHILEPFMFPSETQSELTANLQDSMDPNTAQVEKFFGDASKLGAGHVWMSGKKFINPTVW